MAALTYGLSTTWLVTAISTSSLLRSVLDAVPGMLELHLHGPGRIAFVYFFFAAALTGTGLDKLLAAKGRWRTALPVAITCVLLCIIVFRGPAGLSSPAFGAFYLGLALVVVLVLLVRSQPQGRFFAYDPQTLKVSSNGYRNFRRKKRISRLLGNTQATVYRLEDVQGYNPLHLASYDKLLTVANGKAHKIYRDAYVRFGALDSPLLDMLNARYVLTPEGTRMGPKYRRVPGARGPWLYENQRALPRAWAVHQTAVYDDHTALRLIEGGKVDPRKVAVVSRPISGLQPQSGAELVTVTEHRAERIEISANLSAPGLVVLSELDYPAWKVRVNGALRAVQVPAGVHTVTWYYSSRPTNLGFLLSGLTLLGILMILVTWFYKARSRRGHLGRFGDDARLTP